MVYEVDHIPVLPRDAGVHMIGFAVQDTGQFHFPRAL